MMEYYMKKVTHEERKRSYKHSHDEMAVPSSLRVQEGPKKCGHHMGEYIPLKESEVYGNDVSAQKYAEEAAQRARIQVDNVEHKFMFKTGWKEGESPWKLQKEYG